MSRNRRYAKNAKKTEMEQILDEEERAFEAEEDQFLTDDELADLKEQSGKREKPYYFPASKDQMHLQSYEYLWFSSSR